MSDPRRLSDMSFDGTDPRRLSGKSMGFRDAFPLMQVVDARRMLFQGPDESGDSTDFDRHLFDAFGSNRGVLLLMSHIGAMLTQGALTVDFDCSECVVTATLDSPAGQAAAFPSARVMEQHGSFVPVTLLDLLSARSCLSTKRASTAFQLASFRSATR